MGVKQVKAVINGVTTVLTLNSSTGKYEATITAPAKSSYKQTGHYYPVSVTAEDLAGNTTTVNDKHSTLGLYVYKERWFDFNAFAGTRLWIARYYRGYRTMRFDDEPDQKYKPDVDGDISGWQYTSCGEIPGIKGDVDLDIAYEDPMLWSQPAVEPGVIYTVSVADVWTREQAEILRQQFEAMGINGIIHEVRIVE